MGVRSTCQSFQLAESAGLGLERVYGGFVSLSLAGGSIRGHQGLDCAAVGPMEEGPGPTSPPAGKALLPYQITDGLLEHGFGEGAP